MLFSSKLSVGFGMGSGVGMRFSLVARAVFVWRVSVLLVVYMVCTSSMLLVRFVFGGVKAEYYFFLREDRLYSI